VADRVVEFDQAVDAGADVGELGLVELEPLEQRGGQVAALGRGQVALVGRDDLAATQVEGLGDFGQCRVLGVALDCGQTQRCGRGRRRTLTNCRLV